MLGTGFQDMLRCIRCAACMNHCPVYQTVGGHTYGWVYPGPMGAVLTPALIGVDKAGHLPNASTFCGKCESVCPVKIPLPSTNYLPCTPTSAYVWENSPIIVGCSSPVLPPALVSALGSKSLQRSAAK